MFLTEAEEKLQLRQVAWQRAPAGEDIGGRLSFTHYVTANEKGQVADEKALCGRRLPDEWDITNGRFEHFGAGICSRCMAAFVRRQKQTANEEAD